MLDISLGTFFFLFMRLFPFIIVCFFVIISIFNWDLKGLIYLVGLIITMGIFQLSNGFEFMKPDKGGNCIATPFIDSTLPINQIVIGFTISYLFTTLVLNSYKAGTGIFGNISNPVIPFFLIVFISDILINTNLLPEVEGLISNNFCYTFINSLCLYGISMFLGWIWSSMINQTNNNNYIFFNNYTNDNKKCTTHKTKYKCTRYVNGKPRPN
jgi:hypothetical protein